VGATYGYLAVYVVGDALSAVFGGAITGCGRQRYAAIVVVISYGMIGLPICWYASHALDMGYIGIVVSMRRRRVRKREKHY
jgi:Na+-driven multidrug efflux pump